jgi:hypothetical protein
MPSYAEPYEIARREAGIAPERFRTLKPGQVWEL